MLFVTIFGPLLQKMQRRLKVHRQVGAVLLLLLAVGFLAVLLWVLFSWIVGSLPDWVENLDSLEEDGQTPDCGRRGPHSPPWPPKRRIPHCRIFCPPEGAARREPSVPEG